MQLIKLSANKKTFHVIKFKTGVNLIVGAKSKPDSKDLKNTFNGVGKSLTIQLIHFCLGSDPIIEFQEKLPTWIFYLEFELKKKNYVVSRNTTDQNYVLLNDKRMTIDEYKNFLQLEVFNLQPNEKYISFRTLLYRFIRPTKASYLSFDTYIKEQRGFLPLLSTGYLLGLDPQLIINKYRLKQELDRIKVLKGNIENDEIFNKYFTQDKDVNIEIRDLQDKSDALSKNIKEYKVAKNYYEIEEEANDQKIQLQLLKNKIILIENSLKQINRSLDIKSDISKDTVISLYKEAKVTLGNLVEKRLEDVEGFYTSLTESRKIRLEKEKKNLNIEKASLEEKRKILSDNLDKSLSFLGTHGAFDEYVALNEKLNQINTALEKLKDYKGLLQQYADKTEEMKVELGKETIETNNYLKKIDNMLTQHMDTFRSLSKEFYTDKPGGIEIVNNSGTNQTRFDIKVKIEDDASDGIQEVKIFCFDMTILLGKHNHNMNFIVHDGRLFSNMDPRQITTLFRLAFKHTNKSEFQYIATINENMLADVKSKYLSKDEYKNIITDNTILTLTDESPSSKLLGIQIDMDYEVE
jgi:uncharacterized protein YydD (DUF2326 family)